MAKAQKALPVIIFVLVILIIGILVLMLSGRQSTTKADDTVNKKIEVSKENTDPIENIDQAWSKGNPEAKIKIIEVSDFQCPYCKKGSDTVNQIFDKYKDDIYLTFSHLPLVSIHPDAIPAAKAAEAAGYQGRFWEMSELLFSNQSNLKEADFLTYAKRLGLDIDAFEKYYYNKNIEDKIARQAEAITAIEYEEIAVEQGTNKVITKGKTKISGTPAFIINGKLLYGAYPVEMFDVIIQYFLKK